MNEIVYRIEGPNIDGGVLETTDRPTAISCHRDPNCTVTPNPEDPPFIVGEEIRGDDSGWTVLDTGPAKPYGEGCDIEIDDVEISDG